MQLEDISKSYGKGKQLVKALRNVSFSIHSGQLVGLIGPNGAGKTTLLKVITALTRPDAGRVLLFGQPRSGENNRHLGFLPENPQFFRNITAREMIAFSLELCGIKADADRVRTVLDKVDLLDVGDRPIRTYSKGMRQRIGLAQALAHEPAFLILDEPMSGLDPGSRARMKSILKEYCTGGRSILFSSHDLGDVEDLCSRVLWVENGSIRIDAPIPEILKQSGFDVTWEKNGRTRRQQAAEEGQLWSLLDEIRVSGGHLLRVQRGMAQRIEDLLEIGRSLK